MIYFHYFSPTGNSERLGRAFSKEFANALGYPIHKITRYNLSLYSSRIANTQINFTQEDTLILAMPVYAGRIPNIILSHLNKYEGSQTKLIVIFTYGNRHYDDAPLEAKRLFESHGFNLISIICGIGEHSFSKQIASGRPDMIDLDALNQLAKAIVHTSLNQDLTLDITNQNIRTLPLQTLNTQIPLGPYYQPLDLKGQPYDFKSIKPLVTDQCKACGHCIDVCPMGSIASSYPYETVGKCIKCNACIRQCQVHARVFDDTRYIKHKHELETELSGIRKPIIFMI